MTHSDPENPLDPDVPPAGPVGPVYPADQVPEPPVVIRSIEPSPSSLYYLIIYYHCTTIPHVHNLSRYLLYYLRITNIVY
jgi:hypothetical protein